MYKIDSRTPSIQTMSMSNNMMTSLDNDFCDSEDEEILENVKNKNFDNLYDVFELQVDKEFFKLLTKTKKIRKKIDSKKFVPTVKSIFAPLSKGLKNSKSSLKSTFKNSNTSLKSTYKISDEIKNKVLEEKTNSNISENVEQIKKKNNFDINDSLSMSMDSSFNSCSQQINENDESILNFSIKNNNSKIKNIRSLKIMDSLKRKNCFFLQLNQKNQINSYSNINRSIKQRSSSTHQKNSSSKKEILDKNCGLCKKEFFPKNILARIFLCKCIFHKKCLDEVFSNTKNFNLSCPACFKILLN